MNRPTRAVAPGVPFTIRLSPDERIRLDQAMKANHQTQTEFVRDALMTAADECLEGSPHTKPPASTIL